MLVIIYQKIKNEITKISKIKCIIKCNPRVFTASVDTIILILEKSKYGHDFKNNYITYLDYTNDEMIVKINNGKYRGENFNQKFEEILREYKSPKKLTLLESYNIDWYIPDNDNKYLETYNSIIGNIKIRELTEEYNKEVNNIKANIRNKKYLQIKPITKKITIGELFYIVKKPRINLNITSGMVKLIAARKYNGGFKEFITSNENTFSQNKLVAVTGGQGAAGLVFYQDMPFNITSSTIVLDPKPIFKTFDNKIGEIISNYLSIVYKKKYSFTFQWNKLRMNNDIIELEENIYNEYIN